MYKENSQDILKRMLTNANTSDIEGTLIYDSLSPISKELSKSKNQLEEVLTKVFAKTSFEDGFSKELEMRASEHGIYRKYGCKATGEISINGIKGTKIPKNFIVQTNLGLQFKTITETTITENDTIDIPITSISEGIEYNVKSNAIIETPIKLMGIYSVTNKYDIENGRDTENDRDLYNRLEVKVKTPATSGNIYHYMNWALECNGVGNVIIKPLWNGNGTVKVILVDSNGRCPSIGIIEDTKQHIEKNRPIGATVTVVGVNEIQLNITTKILVNLNSNLNDIRSQIIKNIEEYLKYISLKTNVIRYHKIANCILNVKEVVDYIELKINNTDKDIIMNDDSIAVLESVVVDSVT